MKIGSKYKIARRVGAPVFEKTQTQKFAMRESRRERRNFARSDFGLQLVEKQKVRYTYCITASQFAKYVKKVVEKGSSTPKEMLFAILERRLDNVVYRAGLAKTRLAARQMVNHGHITVNGKRLSIPSYQVEEGDIIVPRMQSLAQPLFAKIDEQLQGVVSPSWLTLDKEKKTVTVKGEPRLAEHEVLFDLAAAIEFHSR
jgi:small subunit ribosomal protein S4